MKIKLSHNFSLASQYIQYMTKKFTIFKCLKIIKSRARTKRMTSNCWQYIVMWTVTYIVVCYIWEEGLHFVTNLASHIIKLLVSINPIHQVGGGR